MFYDRSLKAVFIAGKCTNGLIRNASVGFPLWDKDIRPGITSLERPRPFSFMQWAL